MTFDSKKGIANFGKLRARARRIREDAHVQQRTSRHVCRGAPGACGPAVRCSLLRYSVGVIYQRW